MVLVGQFAERARPFCTTHAMLVKMAYSPLVQLHFHPVHMLHLSKHQSPQNIMPKGTNNYQMNGARHDASSKQLGRRCRVLGFSRDLAAFPIIHHCPGAVYPAEDCKRPRTRVRYNLYGAKDGNLFF